ncbi:unnamed protein product [Lactuca saligna]|uniref:RRM domain-containing protein n=1 Tax=Lactuca saligna TaxID=75948 RepID=A0AA35V4E2_LACSI|nr:unnamed protein product [Lactuca saligna]
MSMFVSNLPVGVRKEALRNVFSKFGEVVDVYMVKKKDVNRKSFAFVRFKKANNNELELERALQGIKIRNIILDINIARFERNQESTNTGNRLNRHLNRFTQAINVTKKDKRTFSEVAASGSKSFHIPPPPPPNMKNVLD